MLFCGTKKNTSQINLRSQQPQDFEFELKEEQDKKANLIFQFKEEIQWSCQINNEENLRKIQKKKEEEAQKAKESERLDKEFQQKVILQEDKINDLQNRNEILTKILDDTKRKFLINAIKNETLKKMVNR